jgi:hypothetical protein
MQFIDKGVGCTFSVAGTLAEIAYIASPAGEEGRVLDSRDRTAD